MRRDDYISPLGYIGYQILYSIPVIGFICLIVFSCDKTNINRRNFALKYWIELIISVVILAIAAIIVAATIGFDQVIEIFNEYLSAFKQ